MKESTNCRMQITIKGIVQGVGFRPFVYNLARCHELNGWVLNDTRGVSIDVEGTAAAVSAFVAELKANPPPQAEIFEFRQQESDPVGYRDFEIRKSEDQQERFVPISPELSTCEDCLRELFDPADRRYRYPFINCTNCGPRFTIVKDIPYDRRFTTMSVFPMCADCLSEYEDPVNRRFHAQPNACPACGPSLTLLDSRGEPVAEADPISAACALLEAGKIVAVKGLGGYHLACNALDQKAVAELRRRKYREYKPFALMVQDLDHARRLCVVSEAEEKLLSGAKRPIVLLRKRPDTPVVEEVAPKQKYEGVMLPYTPLHHLLLRESGLVLVMTSGNISSEPISYQDREALERLGGIADYYLVHDREIHIRTDDSVSRIWRNQETVLRRSRSYAPYPLLLPIEFEQQILACGAELKNTFCLTRGSYVFLSHHIGDLENLETLKSFETGIEHFKRIFNLSPVHIAYDLHPGYLSTRYARKLAGVERYGVQHHHAHMVSCMGENKIDGAVIGVSFDGTGYGLDGNIWGGEFLVGDSYGFQRAAHFRYFRLPGGEQAIKQPWRTAASFLYALYGESMLELELDFIRELDRDKWRVLKTMIDRGVASPLTSSAGRLFDAVAALTGVRREIYYEGQAAIELEMAAEEGEQGAYPFSLEEGADPLLIDLAPLADRLVAELAQGVAVGLISARFHNCLAQIILAVCRRIRLKRHLERVVLSGGVFQNTLLLLRAAALLEQDGFQVFSHHRVPPNDGGISLGQVIVADAWIKRGKRAYAVERA